MWFLCTLNGQDLFTAVILSIIMLIRGSIKLTCWSSKKIVTATDYDFLILICVMAAGGLSLETSTIPVDGYWLDHDTSKLLQ